MSKIEDFIDSLVWKKKPVFKTAVITIDFIKEELLTSFIEEKLTDKNPNLQMGEAFYKSMKEDFDDKGNGYTVIIKSMDLKRVRSLQMFGIDIYDEKG